MAGLYEVELKVLSASNLKNVNWKNGPLRPYVVVWLDTDAAAKATTSIAPLADSGPDGTDPVWDADEDVRAKVILPIPRHTEPHETALLVDVVHAVNREADGGNGKVKPLVGSGRILLQDVLEEVGIGEKTLRSIQLNRPSGRPQGVLDIKICVREPPRSYYYDSRPPPPTAAPYHGSSGYPTNASRDVPYGYGAPPAGYPYGSAPGAPPPTAGYGGYGAPPAGYPAYGGASAAPPAGYPGYGGAAASAPAATKSKSKFGVGTGVAVGAAAGLLGGLALSEGYSHLKENIAEDAAAKVEEDYDYDDDY